MSASASALGGTSGTFGYAPSASAIILYAYGRCGLRGPQLQAEHMRDAQTALNMIQADWANDQVNLWTVELITVPLVYGQIAYTVPSDVILILDAYREINPGSGNPIDLYMYPVSRTEYASYPDKTTVGTPTVYWFNRTLSPTVNLWQPPVETNLNFCYWACRQIMDANTVNEQQMELPYPWLKAMSDALSVQLAILYAPDKYQLLQSEAMMSYDRAKKMGAERVPLYITPGLSGYYR